MDYDYRKRGYLLPEGCKDLVDVLKQADEAKLKDSFEAEFERLAQLDKEWREYLARQTHDLPPQSQ